LARNPEVAVAAASAGFDNARVFQRKAAVQIEIAESDNQIDACFDVLRELRPALVRERFLADVRRMQRGGFRLAALRDPEVRAVVGFRAMEMFHTGPMIYVDDLVTAASARSRGYGAALLGWVRALAEREGCRYVALDSAHVRVDAHRFYRREGFDDIGLHFVVPVGDAPRWQVRAR
jgi:GNAT superfamily N-acetyltransferase